MTTPEKTSAARTPGALAHAWEQRTLLVKRELAEERAAMDAQTARLKALRLERDRQQALVAAKAGTSGGASRR